MASPGALRPRWGQPVTGIVSFFAFFFIAWFIWYIFSDPRGPVGIVPLPLRALFGNDDFGGPLAAYVFRGLAFS